MLDLSKIFRKGDRALRAVIGLSLVKFKVLLPTFAEQLSLVRLSRQSPRVREEGGGREHTLLRAEEKLFFILFYLKVYPTYDVAGVMFGVDASQIQRWVKQYLPILESTLGSQQVLPLRKVSCAAEFLSHFPDVRKVCIDGTEIPVQRPKNKENQRSHYSGKKKRHTCKHTTVSSNRRILILTERVAGTRHDKKDADDNELFEKIPAEVIKEVDLGYVGADKNALNVKIPHKKTKGGV